MSELQYLIDRLNETQSALAHFAEAGNDDDFVRINKASIEKRQRDLHRKIDNSLALAQNDYVSYRIKRDWSGNYPVRAVAASVICFQELFTAVYDALKNGPKKRYRPTSDALEMSSLQFAGAAAGSVVVAMSIPNDRLLIGETELDRALHFVEKTLSAQTADDLNALAKEVGIAAISKAYSWAEVASSYGLDTEICWGRDINNGVSVSLSSGDAAAVKNLIELKSDEATQDIDFACTLLGFDGDTSYFHIMTLDGGLDIKGDVADDVPKEWTTQQRYMASVRSKTQVKYATGEERQSFTLLNLRPLNP